MTGSIEPVLRHQVSTRDRIGRFAGSSFGHGSPLFSRAKAIREGPAAMCQRWPADPIASSDNVRGDRPDSAAAMIAGQASRVEVNRPITLVDGISLSWYSTAPSRQISVFSPGLRAYGFGTARAQNSSVSSGISRSSSSMFVVMTFALRGAPCGDEPRRVAAHGRYHDEQPPLSGPSDRLRPRVGRVRPVDVNPRERVVDHGSRLFEGHPVLPPVDRRLDGVPAGLAHLRTLATAAYLAVTR